jgi:hypothetical protein
MVGALINPNNVNVENQTAELRDAACELGLQLTIRGRHSVRRATRDR